MDGLRPSQLVTEANLRQMPKGCCRLCREQIEADLRSLPLGDARWLGTLIEEVEGMANTASGPGHLVGQSWQREEEVRSQWLPLGPVSWRRRRVLRGWFIINTVSCLLYMFTFVTTYHFKLCILSSWDTACPLGYGQRTCVGWLNARTFPQDGH